VARLQQMTMMEYSPKLTSPNIGSCTRLPRGKRTCISAG
jgi:hypothetical protein